MNKKYYVSESAFINVSCDLAKRMMEERLGDKYPLMFEDNGNCYNEEGQEHFNQLYEQVQNILEDADIVPNDIKLYNEDDELVEEGELPEILELLINLGYKIEEKV